MTQGIPPLEIYIMLQEANSSNEQEELAEDIKSKLEAQATDLKLAISPSHKYLGGKTNKETFEKIFGGKVEYGIDEDYNKTEKIWIEKKQPTVPENLKYGIKEVGLDYW